MNKQSRRNSQHGFTIIELLVALLITGILMATVTAVFLMSQKVYTRGTDISYKQKSITNIETDLQNVLATATGFTTASSQPTTNDVYGIGFNDQGECVEVINGTAYQTDQITEINFNVSNGNTMNYEIVPKHEMSVLEGGIVMNNIKSATLNTQLNGDDKKGFLVITLVN
ncbi:prepilin-type N-terminal cleavage/methylation domain-containing protein [Acetobacterium malicum]|uniref:Prepilin-type N-terminal cleavage/methylation domain-containing protein n=1 Tax=Acetobacterium malicum TaxID=52692 RepID=A0ABR6YXL6_9FIRM|nr:prepilin-type N-terminal cleavage/methylation domain-containing protein [Acetobacterium malicum]MBC3899899.1 prepilin-type N-terminal cleavage/methylation domain-containing protein [Acetobacterium malicum]